MSNRKKYTEDSTRGAALFNNPKSYKGDVLVQCWVDSRVLATLSEWLDNGGTYTRFMSEVVKVPLEVLANHLIMLGEITMVDDTSSARKMLEQKYRVNLNPGGRGVKNAHHNRLVSDLRGSLGGRVKIEKEENVINRPLTAGTSSGVDIDELMKLYKEKEIADMVAESKKLTDELEVDDKGVVIVESHNHGDYTEEDKLRDEEIKKLDVNDLAEKCEMIAKERITGKSKDELDASFRRIEEKDRKEKKAWSNINPSDLKPLDEE